MRAGDGVELGLLVALLADVVGEALRVLGALVVVLVEAGLGEQTLVRGETLGRLQVRRQQDVGDDGDDAGDDACWSARS